MQERTAEKKEEIEQMKKEEKYQHMLVCDLQALKVWAYTHTHHQHMNTCIPEQIFAPHRRIHFF